MKFPEPQVGLVIRYSFLWSHEHASGRDEGAKDRPCAIVIVVRREGKNPLVRVLPITHSPPADGRPALEIPIRTKAFLGLDAERSWIILDEANDFVWPGPDLRPAVAGDMTTAAYGPLPKAFMKVLAEKLLVTYEQKRARTIKRTE